jgi:hypothetical protein
VKTNDSDSAGFEEMVAAAPQTELDRLANLVGSLAADVDDLKRRPAGENPPESVVAKALVGYAQRIDAIEKYLNHQMQDTSVQRDQLERNTRHSALDLAIKVCPQGTEFDTLHKVYEGMLGILRGMPVN